MSSAKITVIILLLSVFLLNLSNVETKTTSMANTKKIAECSTIKTKYQSQKKKTKKTNTNKKKKSKVKIKLKSYSVPKEASSFKTYMSYKCISSSSPQGKLQKKAYTSPNGLRKVDKYYCIALGSYYGSKIGTKYKITLSSGKYFWGILADQKANCHTNSTNQYTLRNGDVIEFIVDTPKLPSSVRISGDISSISKFKGKVKKIEKVI